MASAFASGLSPTPLRRRILAGLLAAGATALLLVGLNPSGSRTSVRADGPALQPGLRVRLIPAVGRPAPSERVPTKPLRVVEDAKFRPATVQPMLQGSPAPKDERRAAVTAPVDPSMPASPAGAPGPADSAAPTHPPVAAQEAAASAPLRLDAGVLRQAATASRGVVRGLAQASGQDLDAPGPDRGQVLAPSVAHSVRPDCLAPNASGNLLSVVVIAVQVASGNCK